MHHLNAALRAHALYKRDVEYIVRGGEVIIVDEFTGRTMPGRRWSDGLHQAVEAKERVRVREENQTVASITFQNYFRLYKKLSGMTGTADTEAPEFLQIYGLEVVVIPTHRPMIRKDQSDFVYLTQKDKFEAIIEDIRDCAQRAQPVLVGTTSIETSEFLSGLLQKEGVAHEVLNAKQHEREAHVVAQAGPPGAGDDRDQHGRPRHRHRARRQPGGGAARGCAAGGASRGRYRAARARTPSADAPGCPPSEAGGGARRCEAERRGTRGLAGAARPGDRGRRAAHRRHRAPRVTAHRQSAARPLGPPGRSGLEPLLSVDGRQPDADLRRSEPHQAAAAVRRHEGGRGHRERHALAPDREGAAQGRGAQLRYPQAAAAVRRRRQRSAQGDLSAAHRDPGHRRHERRDPGDVRRCGRRRWSTASWSRGSGRTTGTSEGLQRGAAARLQRGGGSQGLAASRSPSWSSRRCARAWSRTVRAAYQQKVERIGAPIMRYLEREIVLRMLDQHWRDHLAAMDYLRQGIHLRGYAQKDYRYEYKREAFELFSAMLDRVKFDTVSRLATVEVRTQEQIDREEAERRERLMRALQAQHAELQSLLRRASSRLTPEMARRRSGGIAAPGSAPAPWPGRRARRRQRPARPSASGSLQPTGAVPRRGRRSCARDARSAATSPVPAARARSTSIATGHWRAPSDACACVARRCCAMPAAGC